MREILEMSNIPASVTLRRSQHAKEAYCRLDGIAHSASCLTKDPIAWRKARVSNVTDQGLAAENVARPTSLLKWSFLKPL